MMTRTLLAAIVAAAIFLRTYYAFETGGLAGYLAWGDVHYYGGIARENLWNAEWLANGEWDKMFSAHAIGYPLLIAPLNALGFDPVIFRFIQIAMDSAACTLAYLVAREFRLGEAAGLLAAGMYALAQSFAWSAGLLLAESLLPATMLAALYLLLRLRSDGRPWVWLATGAAIGVIPTLRTEMALLIVPIAVLLVIFGSGAWSIRARKAGTVIAGFTLVLLAASSISWATHGNFGLSKNLKWYGLYSGLGNIENPHGYVANDTLAEQQLNALGMAYHSPESEQFWKAKYLKAWTDHPGYVLRTIAYRVKAILVVSDTVFQDRHWRISQGALRAGLLFALPAALLMLAWRRDWLLGALLLLPVVYAIGTIGIIHFEPRYVRYAHLTHLFAWAILIDAMLKFRLPALARFRF